MGGRAMAASPDPWRVRGGFPDRPLGAPDTRRKCLQAAKNYADRAWRDRPITITHERTGELWVRRHGSWFKERAARERDDI